jgi:hypothetical protein
MPESTVSSIDDDDFVEGSLSVVERAAIRAYLQRSEVRLSTLHRVASALLSGAGLMVLLPSVAHDSVVTVVSSLLTGGIDAVHLLLVIGVAASLALPFTALWLVLRDLTQFYFHANHLRHAGGETFTPRFTLTGLRLPVDELDEANRSALDRARTNPRNVELLVSPNDASRRRIDDRIAAYGGLGFDVVEIDDRARAAALFELAAARPRDLLDEVAKVEHGMARHVLRTQAIVLRYVKALLALLTTAFATFAAAGVIDHPALGDGLGLGPGQEVWLAAILLIWAPVVIFAVTTPVRWLDRQLRSEGAGHTGVADDHELTRVEDVTVRLAVIGFIASAAAMVVALFSSGLTDATVVGGVVVLALAFVSVMVVMRVWSHGHPMRRLLHTT